MLKRVNSVYNSKNHNRFYRNSHPVSKFHTIWDNGDRSELEWSVEANVAGHGAPDRRVNDIVELRTSFVQLEIWFGGLSSSSWICHCYYQKRVTGVSSNLQQLHLLRWCSCNKQHNHGVNIHYTTFVCNYTAFSTLASNADKARCIGKQCNTHKTCVNRFNNLT